jgi:hypothetical protein
MRLVSSPVEPGQTGSTVANRQDAVLLLIERGFINSFTGRNRPTVGELQTINNDLIQERGQARFDDDGQLDILRKYGYEDPGFTDAPNADNRRVLNQVRVIAVTDRYDAEWMIVHRAGRQHMNDVTDEDIAAQPKAQAKREAADAQVEGARYATTSLLAAAAAHVASKFIDDPKNFTAAARAVQALAGAAGSYAYAKSPTGAYMPDVVNKPSPNRSLRISARDRVKNWPSMAGGLAKWGMGGSDLARKRRGRVSDWPRRSPTIRRNSQMHFSQGPGQLCESNNAGSSGAEEAGDGRRRLGLPVRRK